VNCETFNDVLPEYLDGTLLAAEQAAAREHVAKCGVCQLAVAKQEALARTLQHAFNREVERLSLSAKTREIVLDALKRQELEPTTRRERLLAYLTVPWWNPACAGFAFVCLLMFVFAGHFHVLPAGRSDLQPMARESGDSYVVDVPIESEMHFFRRRNGSVVDAVITEAGIISANFSRNTHPSSSLKQRVNYN
jgi:hypothetical protein